MGFQPATRHFLSYLQKHPEVRHQIRAGPDRTLLYAGSFFKPMWREIADYKHAHPELAQKQMLPDVLSHILVPGTGYLSLLAYVQDLERQVPWQPDGFTVWRALSGVFASNAIGAVSFQIGSGVEAAKKVFAATEASVLARNPHVDVTTKDLLAYFQRCIQTKQADINLGFISA